MINLVQDHIRPIFTTENLEVVYNLMMKKILVLNPQVKNKSNKID